MAVSLLIVEADSFFRISLSQRLRTLGYRIFEAGQQSETKKILKRKNIDVVLLGLSGLKRQGLALLKLVKKLRPPTEVIIINKSEQLSLSIEGMKMGAFDDVLVPFDLDVLIHRIQAAYQRKRKKEKSRVPLFRRYQDMMVAASFAEAGETDAAREFLGKEHETLSNRSKRRRGTPS